MVQCLGNYEVIFVVTNPSIYLFFIINHDSYHQNYTGAIAVTLITTITITEYENGLILAGLPPLQILP